MYEQLDLEDVKHIQDWQTHIYNQNCRLGWHTGKRSFAKFICLFHSEASEGVEGLRKHLPDDHIEGYAMLTMEIVDVFIRCVDWLGSKNYNWESAFIAGLVDIPELQPSDADDDGQAHNLANIHMMISEAWVWSHTGECAHAHRQIARAAATCWCWLLQLGYNPNKVVGLKVDYNKERADHKIEARQGEGGKRW